MFHSKPTRIGCILQRSRFPLLMKHIHACRFVYNHSLEQKIRAYEQEGRNLSSFDLNNRLPALKEEHPWL
ncbi:MAG: helix-turn-helix domain-containing protein, partial [Candidatus Methanoculleus thermohydrogenotrophicum]